MRIITALRRLYVVTVHPLTAAFLAYFGCLLVQVAIQDRTTFGIILFGGLALSAFGTIAGLVYYSVRWWKPVRLATNA